MKIDPDNYFLTLQLAKRIPIDGKDHPETFLQHGIWLDFYHYNIDSNKCIADIKTVSEKHHIDYHRLVSFRSEWNKEHFFEVRQTIGTEGKRFDWQGGGISTIAVADAIKDEMLQRWPKLNASFQIKPDGEYFIFQMKPDRPRFVSPMKPDGKKYACSGVYIKPGPRKKVWAPLMVNAMLIEILRWVNDSELKSIEKRLSHFKTESDREDLRYQFNLFAEKTIRRWFLDHGWEVTNIAPEPETESTPEPDLLSEKKEPTIQGKNENFDHSSDYSTVTKDGIPYPLLQKQALVIKKLHEEYKKNGAGATVCKKELLEFVSSHKMEHGFPSRVRDIFKSRIDAYHNLVEVVSRRLGLYRLNI